MKHTRREFVKIMFVATQAAALGQFLTSDLLADDAVKPADAAKGFNFIAFGDWGRKGVPDQIEVANEMGKVADQIKPKFIISVGDNFYESGVTSTDDEQWKSSYENVYKSDSLQIPWYVILGNHDYIGNCDAQIDYTKVSHRWNMPARYYSQSHVIDAQTNLDMFYIDTTPMLKSYHKEEKFKDHFDKQDTRVQLEWLKKSLEQSKAQWKLVIGHHPIYSGGEHGDTKELIEDVLPLLKKYNVQAYFNGHDHDLQHLQAGTVNLFCTGAGSQVRPTKPTTHTQFSKTCPGFVKVSIEPSRMLVHMIDNHGKNIYTAVVPREPK